MEFVSMELVSMELVSIEYPKHFFGSFYTTIYFGENNVKNE